MILPMEIKSKGWRGRGVGKSTVENTATLWKVFNRATTKTCGSG
jgi:hypothetical protein